VASIPGHGHLHSTDYRGESLRDYETCLSVQASKLYHRASRERFGARKLAVPTSRANELYEDMAQRVFDRQGRKLYARRILVST